MLEWKLVDSLCLNMSFPDEQLHAFLRINQRFSALLKHGAGCQRWFADFMWVCERVWTNESSLAAMPVVKWGHSIQNLSDRTQFVFLDYTDAELTRG